MGKRRNYILKIFNHPIKISCLQETEYKLKTFSISRILLFLLDIWQYSNPLPSPESPGGAVRGEDRQAGAVQG